MSNTLAISAVTEALSSLLRTVKDDPALDPTLVTQDPPDRARDGQRTGHQLNLFLYMVSPNPGLSNADVPFRDAEGNVSAQPVLALDLHYLLTAYGNADNEVDAQHVLAAAMSVIHDTGFIPRETIRSVVTAQNSSVAGADLADQIDIVRLCPEKLTDEDLYRLWSMFQTRYRLSVGYLASVVLVQRAKQFSKAPPVTRAGATAATLRRPEIADVSPQPAHTGDTLSLSGRNLLADSVTVRINGADVPTTSVADDDITLGLPAGLRAGPNVVQVIHGHTLEVIDDARNVFASDPVPFIVAPRITTASPIDAPEGGRLQFDIDPAVTRTQRVVALIDAIAVERDHDPPNVTAQTSHVSFSLPASLTAGTDHLVRVEVDGVESRLEQDTTPGPDFGLFTGPKVHVTP
jgi:hypothetical protein